MSVLFTRYVRVMKIPANHRRIRLLRNSLVCFYITISSSIIFIFKTLQIFLGRTPLPDGFNHDLTLLLARVCVLTPILEARDLHKSAIIQWFDIGALMYIILLAMAVLTFLRVNFDTGIEFEGKIVTCLKLSASQLTRKSLISKAIIIYAFELDFESTGFRQNRFKISICRPGTG